MDDGWIKWHRKSLNNPLFRDSFGWHLWEYCCLKANHGPHKVIFQGKPMTVNRGQFLFGRHQAAADTGIPAGSIHRKMKLLKNLQMLSIKSSNKFSIVTIENYDKYQIGLAQSEQQDEQQMSNKRASSEHQVSTNKNDKNDKKKEKLFVEGEPPFDLTRHLLTRIRENNPNFKKPDLQKWSEEIDRMLRLDGNGREPEKIRAVIDWCQRDDFWRSNILSAYKLRKQFDALTEKMKQRPSGSPRVGLIRKEG